ncbi:Glycosyl hydrolases family 43 [Phytophthora infestans]|uniref:arabinan endo-1,5-alpha-L-arabinosidase n=1 Tax=Phytophthora infestans TaxID=4787 RepID=A0A8S9TM01_PHYIN|nr:Glycosyl hydrolases family 43 [Phytophthora infestans]KAF4133273.1 Glycosyl hydrolases family 43 [Phytophthora infestans]
MKLISILVGLPLLVAGVTNGYAYPQACSGVCTNAHDPSIIRRDDGTYFRFSTGNKIAIHSAPDLTGPWKYLGAAVPDGSKINLKGRDDLWAPEVNKIGDTYYLYYSVSSFGTQSSAIGLTQSKTMEAGSWVDAGASPDEDDVAPNEEFWRKCLSNRLHLEREVVEAAFEFAYNGYYYLFFSKGSCCQFDKKRPAKGKEYRILVCRSKSPTGGFVDKDNVDCRNNGSSIVLESHDWVYGPGGQGVYNDPTHGPVMYYHYVDTRIGFADGDKRFGWNKLDFSSGWPTV